MMTFVLANPGSAILTLEDLHLIVLNLFIGVIEGWIVARFARVRLRRAVAIMILANYVSAWIGTYLLPELAAQFEAAWAPEPPLYHVGRLLALLAAIAFVLAVGLEFPFVLWATSGRKADPVSATDQTPKPGRRGTTFGGRLALCTASQAVTYLGMGLLYASVSDISLLTSTTRIRDTLALTGGAQGWVYYLRRGGTEIWRARLDRPIPEWWANSPDRDGWGGGIWAERTGDGLVRLMQESREPIQVGPAFDGVLAARSERYPNDGPQLWEAMDFRPSAERSRDLIRPSFGTLDGGLEHMVIENDGTKHRGELNVVMMTPLCRWRALFPTVLPNGSVVFQFGVQIVVMDRQKRIGVLCMGESPVVVLDDVLETPDAVPGE
jgi:hypothetical protein